MDQVIMVVSMKLQQLESYALRNEYFTGRDRDLGIILTETEALVRSMSAAGMPIYEFILRGRLMNEPMFLEACTGFLTEVVQRWEPGRYKISVSKLYNELYRARIFLSEVKYF